MVYAEHRFYGESLPFGNTSFLRRSIHLLTVEQAMADYANLIGYMKSLFPSAKVLTLGGSYGGMLSSWMRVRYPSLVFAAVASSAPVKFDLVGPSFFALVTDAAASMHPECPRFLREGFSSLAAAAPEHIRTAFGLCGHGTPAEIDVTETVLWARNAFVTAAMGNYPYKSDLFGPGLGAWPLRTACDALVRASSTSPLAGLAAGVNSYYNASGDIMCHNVSEEYRTCADQTGCGTNTSLWGEAWDVEACTEIVYFTSTNNVTDAFPPRAWGLPQLREYCFQRWGVVPQPDWFRSWLEGIKRSSHVIFTNGLLDPWRGGGILENLSATVVAVTIPEAAHIYDLAGTHPGDTAAVVDARRRVAELLRTWLADGDRDADTAPVPSTYVI